MDEILPGGLNLGLTTRSEYTGRSRIVELISPIHVDMFFQEKLLINGVDLHMRFIRAKKYFCLMSDGAVEYRVSIVSANVFIKKVSIAPGIKLAHARALNQANVYPVDRVCQKNVSISVSSISALSFYPYTATVRPILLNPFSLTLEMASIPENIFNSFRLQVVSSKIEK